MTRFFSLPVAWTRKTLLGAACGVAFLTGGVAAQAEPTLTVGSKAPSLDIEHYIHEDLGKFGPVTDFEDGKIYVVEFWATWCGPCIQSMPHLVELQERHRENGVQIVSISDEDLETVEGILERDYPGKEGVTFAELTSAYTLTVDPDGSSTDDYMRAANQNGIPAAFLVGKTGLIEWIGHPMSLDEPLEQVIEGTWDREAFKESMARQQRLEEAMQKVNRLAGEGNFDDAIKVIDKILEEFKDVDDEMGQSVREQLTQFKYGLRLDSGDLSEDVMTYFRGQLKDAKGNPQAMAQFSYGLMSSIQQGAKVGKLADETLVALNAEIEGADPQIQPLMHVLVAQMNASLERFDAAIEAQKQAIEKSEGRQKDRMESMLEELEELADAGSATEESGDEKEDSSEDGE
ncbi:TlpA family protein disulfide reductase [Rhodopirellula europaea]|jgi:thiol-disulfide isomerase/thioredoxin|uniref:TlpA family protein disulfide reductase n=1 Tax=Rhodopirellula europaea TaxID=1263866 RepID=UPI00055D7414|nr:redoxin domain-containing protein [Rhodopirellula europaea]MCR9207529.1 redoxin domain-containing protein [bacterium]